MSTTTDLTRIFTRQQVENLLAATIGKTLLQIDKAQLFARHEGSDKVKGIAGDIIEESVLGCKKDNLQEPDILVDGVLMEIKTTGMVKPKKKDSPYIYECKEPVSITAVSIPVIVTEEFEDSNFWHKLAHMIWVYYWYKSPVSVKLMHTLPNNSLHSFQETQLPCTSHKYYFSYGQSSFFLSHKQPNVLMSKSHCRATNYTHAHDWHHSLNFRASALS